MDNNLDNKKVDISIVVPLLNEEGNVEELHQKIIKVCQDLKKTFEIIFVDDGSNDGTFEKCLALSPLKLIQFRRNFGQTAAFDAGIKASKGRFIVTMDGDLQNDPVDIPKILDKMNEGLDVVSGWRYERKDNLEKRVLSRGANKLRKIFLNDTIHDSGCSLKVYKRECFDDLDLFGEMHRFIPALLEIQGFKVGEVKVSHHPRKYGKTKYNWKRVVKSLVDMMAIWFWRKFANRPLHLFGASGVMMSFFGSIVLLWVFIERVFFQIPVQGRFLPVVGVFMFLVGIQLFVSGLLADISVKNYYKVKKSNVYSIKDVINKD